MDTEILSDMGLTNAEIKIYLALLGLGNVTAGPIIKKTNLQNSVVHSTLPKLAEKGVISFVKKGGIKVYSATDPQNIINFIEEKKNRFERLLPELLKKQAHKQSQEAAVYQGFKGLKSMLYELIKESKKGDEYLFFVFDTAYPEKYEKVYDFYKLQFHNERKKRGIKEKGLSPERLKKLVKSAKWTKGAIKFVSFPIPTNLSIFQDKVAFTPWDDGEVSFLIHSKQLAESFRHYFYSIWKTAKR